MAARVVQARLKYLHEKIHSRCEIPLTDENEVSDKVLRELNIRRISFEPERMHVESINRLQDPPILFQAMSPEELARYPLDPYYSKPGTMDYPEYNSASSTHMFARAIASHIVHYAVTAMRQNIPQGDLSLLEVQGLDNVTEPNELLLNTGLTGHYLKDGRFRACWSTVLTAESHRVNGRRVHPHLTLGVTQHCDGREETILYSELDPIIDAMHARTLQTVVSEEEEAALFEREAFPPSGPPAFNREKRFPVLLLSFVGPHHGRVFYACMDGTELVIRQSRLYDFSIQSTAPVDLFTRLYLSRPLSA